MSQADRLLDSLYENTDISEEEGHIVIDKNRYITVPEKLKRIAVQHDHNIERATFDCPRYWDEHDLSKMKIYINFKCFEDNTQNTNTGNTETMTVAGSAFVTGFDIAENIVIDENDPDMIHFDWVVSGDATTIAGPLMFLVCAKTVDEDGKEILHWNTELNTEMFVSEGLESEKLIRELYPDVVTQLLEASDRVNAISETLENHLENGDFELGLPIVTRDDDGRILRVENGEWCADELRVYDGGVIAYVQDKVDIVQEGVPTTDTESTLGSTYMDSLTGEMYKCVSSDDGTYIWLPIIPDSISRGIDAFSKAFETEGANILDPDNSTNGYYINTDGEIGPDPDNNRSCKRTINPIPVEGGSTLYISTNIKNHSGNAAIYIWQLDNSGTCLGHVSTNLDTLEPEAERLVVVEKKLHNDTATIHVHVNGSRQFGDFCLSTINDGYKQFGTFVVAKALKYEMLPDQLITEISEAKQDIEELNRKVDETSVEMTDYVKEYIPKIQTRNIMDLTFERASISGGVFFKSEAGEASAASEGYIEVTGGKKYIFSWASLAYPMRIYIYQYAADKTYMSYKDAYVSSDKKNVEFTFDDSCAYVRIRLYSDRSTDWTRIVPVKFQMEMGDVATPYIPPKVISPSVLTDIVTEGGELEKLLINNMYKKKIVFLGDSIFGNNRTSTGVVNQIAARVAGTVINCAFGGTRMTLRQNANPGGYDKFDFPSIVQAIKSRNYSEQEQAITSNSLPTHYPDSLQLLKDTDFDTVDIIVFNYGTNDWTWNVTKDSYQEAMTKNITDILEQFPQIQFVAVTPTWRCTINKDGDTRTIVTNSDTETYTMGTVRDVISNMKEVAENTLHIPVIDCYNIGINRYNFANYFDGTDGTHQNAAGRELLARHIASKLF